MTQGAVGTMAEMDIFRDVKFGELSFLILRSVGVNPPTSVDC